MRSAGNIIFTAKCRLLVLFLTLALNISPPHHFNRYWAACKCYLQNQILELCTSGRGGCLCLSLCLCLQNGNLKIYRRLCLIVVVNSEWFSLILSVWEVSGWVTVLILASFKKNIEIVLISLSDYFY